AEVAPGIDIDRDILRHLPFRPIIHRPATMDAAIFRLARMGLRERMLELRMDERLSYDAPTNTVFMNFAGMRVRNSEDVRGILAAVDAFLEPVGHRVNCIVNYEGFTVDDEATHEYMEAVRYVEHKYYLKVSRFTNNGFLRIKFARELESRALTSKVF